MEFAPSYRAWHAARVERFRVEMNEALADLFEQVDIVFCAVSPVIAEVPKTRRAANVRRSAWIPAPPPESEPAIVRATCTPPMSHADRPWERRRALC